MAAWTAPSSSSSGAVGLAACGVAPSGGAEAEAGWAAASGAGVDAEVGGDVLVEAVLAFEQRFDPAQEGARLGALDHPVVVGRGQRHHLGDAELAQPVSGVACAHSGG